MKNLLVNAAWCVTIFVGLLLGGLFGSESANVVVGSHPGSKAQSTQPVDELAQGLKLAAEKINQRGAVMVDSETRWDSASFKSPHELTYHFTMINFSSRDLDTQWLTNNLAPIVRDQACKSGQLNSTLKLGARYNYAYSGNDGQEIGRFGLTRAHCAL